MIDKATRQYIREQYSYIREAIKTFQYPAIGQTDNPFEAMHGFIPIHMREGLVEYIIEGRPTGEFLRYVISGKLFEAASHADDKNLTRLHVYVGFLYNHAPSSAWGSEEKYKEYTADFLRHAPEGMQERPPVG